MAIRCPRPFAGVTVEIAYRACTKDEIIRLTNPLMKKPAILLNLLFFGLAALASLLVLSKWNRHFHSQPAEIGTIRPRPSDSNGKPAKWEGVKTDHPESGGRENGGYSTQDRQIEAAHHAIVNVQFPAKLDGAEAILTEELRFIHSLPPSRERKYLFSFLAEA